MSAPRRPSSANAGFLLVEALASLVLSAFILVGLASLVSVALKTGDRTAVAVQRLETESRVFLAVEREVRRATRVRWSGEAKAEFVFTGLADRMMFTSRRAGADGLGRDVAIVYQSAEGEGGSRLLRAEAPLPPGTTDAQALRLSPQATVHAGHRAFRFAYFALQKDGSGEVLTDDWSEPTRLPTAVRLTLVDPATDQIIDSLRIPLLVDAEPGCAVAGRGNCSLVDEGGGGAPGEGGQRPERPDGKPPEQTDGEGRGQ